MPLSVSQDHGGLNSQGIEAFRKLLGKLSQENAGTRHGPLHNESNIKALTEIKNNKRNKVLSESAGTLEQHEG